MAHQPTIRERIDRLPPLPYVGHDILLASLDERTSAEALAARLRREPGIAARIVSAANAAWFAGRQPATDLRDAVVRLGFGRLRTLLTGLMIGPEFDTRRCARFDAAAFWKRAVAGGFAAGRLARLPEVKQDPGAAELAALLSRIGLLLLAHALPIETDRALQAREAEPGRDLDGFLRAQLGTTTVEATTLLLREWDLPTAIVHTVEAAGKAGPPPAGSLAMIVRAADAWAASGFEATPTGLGSLVSADGLERTRIACLREWESLDAVAELLAS